MSKLPRATIVFYDEGTQQLRMCTVFRREVQTVIDRELDRSGGMTIPPDAPEHSSQPICDEDARKLGAMAILMQAVVHDDLRKRLQITTADPIDWTPAKPPAEWVVLARRAAQVLEVVIFHSLAGVFTEIPLRILGTSASAPVASRRRRA
jgi:hypothetical protein